MSGNRAESGHRLLRPIAGVLLYYRAEYVPMMQPCIAIVLLR